MRAILRDRKGFSREMAVQNPPPPIIKMAQASEATQLAQWISEGEPKLVDVEYTEVVFRYKYKLADQDAVLYEEDIYMPPSAKQFHSAQSSKEQLALMEKAWQKSLHGVCDHHKQAYKYGSDIETLMAEAAKDTPVHTSENPYDYLTRLYNIAMQQKGKMIGAAGQNQMAYGQLEQWATTNTNLFQGTPQYQGLSGGTEIFNGFTPISVPPKVEPKPVKDSIPEPVEPQKRMMKKD